MGTNEPETKHAFEGAGQQQKLPLVASRIVEAGAVIASGPPHKLQFLHSVLAQAGLPRSVAEGRTFERRSGAASLLIEAGALWNGRRFVKQQLPYGTRPRLALIHICSEAKRNKSATVEVGRSVRKFLAALGITDTGGKEYENFNEQMRALAACRMTLGFRNTTMDARPLRKFSAWGAIGAEKLFPGTVHLTEEFYQSLREHAVPLDPRAIAALKHSSLALDAYTWLAHRLRRLDRSITIPWSRFRDQFGQEYGNPKDFNQEMKKVLRQVHAVYPAAGLEQVDGGMLLRPSPSPIPATRVVVKSPGSRG